MKKLGISLVAILVGLPTIAHATVNTINDLGTVTANTNVATTSFVRGAYNAIVGEVNTAIGEINTDIGTKQDQLVNDAQSPADINSTVKTTVAAAATASDTALVTEKAVRTAVDNAITAATYDDSALSGRVTSLETTVGDANSGLVKDVADNASDISALETTVGDANSGLVKGVADNASDISALQTTVGDANSGLVQDVAGLQTTVGNTALTTTAQTVTGAINELKTATTAAGNKVLPVYGTWNSDNSTGNAALIDAPQQQQP